MLHTPVAGPPAAPSFARLQKQVREIAGVLEEKDSIPWVHEEMALIRDVQTDEWGQDVTVPMLEVVRRRLRNLVQFIEKQKRKLIYTDFEDRMGQGTAISLPGLDVGTDIEKFRDKARAFLRA